MLAVIEADGNLSVYDANGKNPVRITTDAVNGEKLYQWPTWSNDGRLAFFGASNLRPDAYSLRTFLVQKVASGATPEVMYTSQDDIFTYPYWSTGDCDPNGCRDLLLLYTPSAGPGLALRAIRAEGDGKTFSTRELGRAAPFYYSFSPDGKQMIWAQNGQTLSLYDTVKAAALPLPDTIGRFNAPAWSPIDSRVLIGVEGSNPDVTDVVIAQGTARSVILENQEPPVSFAWSPDARYIASVSAFAQVVITDVATGLKVSESSLGNVAAHFWSPTSDRVAYIVVNRTDPNPQARLRANGRTVAEQASGGLSLFILDIKTGNSQAIATFNPTRDMVYLLNFFDQFARSHQLWSPDGKYITYGALDSKGNGVVYIADTRQPTTPYRVTAGSIGIWSWK